MIAYFAAASPPQAKGIAAFLPAIAIIFAIVSYLRRKEEIGGWFLYFYYWMFVVFYLYLQEFLRHLNLYLPSTHIDEAHRLALLLAVVPRLFVFSAVIILMVILANTRDWVWVQRLRLVFGAAVLIAAISVAIDVDYFPASTYVNTVRLFMLVVWFLYLCVSERVRRVFLTKDWLDPVIKTASLPRPAGSS